MEMGPIDIALLRNAEDRVVSFRRALEDCRDDDPRRSEIAAKLNEAQRRFDERERYLQSRKL